jgi:phosphate starvation-inducible PhoH-like protein
MANTRTKKTETTQMVRLSKKEIITNVIDKPLKKKFLSEGQRKYFEALIEKEIVLCTGPAGVGKSYVAMNAAIHLLADPSNSYEKIIIVRPAVEAEEKLGALPGNVEEKLDPYIFPSYYLLNKIIGKESREKLKELEVIEVFALAYMRLLLTRIGFNSKFFISGDLEQTDRYKDKTHTGLWDAIEKFSDIPEIGVHKFDNKDIIRNPIITKILQKYD